MSRLVVGVFEREEDLLGAAAAARGRGYPLVDAYTPVPVHGLDEAMGIRPSRLGLACFAFGLAGAAAAFALQAWTHGVDWRLDVGGRPFNAWPAYVPVAFEVMVLLAGVLTVLSFLVVSRLYPGREAEVLDPRATDGRFLLVVEASGAASDPEPVLDLLRAHGAVEASDREPPPARPCGALRTLLPWGLGIGTAATMGLALLLPRDPGKPMPDFLPGMVDPVAFPSDAAHPDLPGGMAHQPPQEGTIPRGRMPLHFAATPEDAERAGRELASPFAAGDATTLLLGEKVYGRHCAVCHGAGGAGDGPVTRRGVPPPPSLLSGKSAGLPEGQLFHIVTYGQGNMAAYADQLTPEERWAVVRYVTGMQGR